MAVISVGAAWQNLGQNSLTVQNVGLPGDVIDVVVSVAEPAATDRGYTLDQIKETYRIAPEAGESVFIRYRRLDGAVLGARTGQLYVVSISDDRVKPLAEVEIATSSGVVREYVALSQPRVLVTTIDQTEMATIEGDRFSSVKVFSNFDINTPVYVLVENPAGSGINAAFLNRLLKSFTSGIITFQVLWDYDVSTATKIPVPAFNENNLLRGIKESKIEISLLNPATTPANGDWLITGQATIISEGIEREIDFIPTTGVGANTSGGVSAGSGFRLYGQGTGALVKVVSSANDNRVKLGYGWVEAPATV